MKNPDSRQASSGLVGEQICLFDPPPFNPIYPSHSSLPGKAIVLLMSLPSLTSPEFQVRTKSWRLAAYINSLKNDGWPIVTIEIPFADDPSRTIAKYVLPDWVKSSVIAQRSVSGGGHAKQ